MNRLLLGLIASVGIAAATHGAERVDNGLEARTMVASIPTMTRLHSWEALDDQTLIVWVTPLQPYLVELQWPSHDLRGAHTIGLTSYGNRISARSDSVTVRGLQYPISRIYRLTREEVRDERFTW